MNKTEEIKKEVIEKVDLKNIENLDKNLDQENWKIYVYIFIISGTGALIFKVNFFKEFYYLVYLLLFFSFIFSLWNLNSKSFDGHTEMNWVFKEKYKDLEYSEFLESLHSGLENSYQEYKKVLEQKILLNFIVF